MHPDFADWFRIASIEPRDLQLTKRWEAIEAFAKNSATDDLLESARLFYGIPLKDNAFIDRFRAIFKDSDETFSLLDNNAEVRVLAGASLVAHFGYGKWGEVAALALTAGEFHSYRYAPVADIVRTAREFLSKKSAALRSREGKRIALADFAKQMTALQKALEADGTLPSIIGPLSTILQSLTVAVSEIVQQIEMRDQHEAMYREESDVLWWLYGRHSRELGIPFGELRVPGACLVLAKELADLTATIPGPYAARAFLDNAIRDAHPTVKGKVALGDAIAACGEDWRDKVGKRADVASVEDLCPTLFAIRRAAESGGKKSWQTVFFKMTGIKASVALDPVDLAEQAYEEWLLARALKNLEDDESDHGR